jgi:hypothetical protein
MMKQYNLYLLLIALVPLTTLIAANLSCQGSNTILGNVEFHTYPPPNSDTEFQTQQNNSTTQTQLNSPNSSADQTVERNITVDEKNSVFSIGIPAGYKENTSVSTAKPIDFWFEYLPSEAILEIDGNEIQFDSSRRNTKIAFTKSVTYFSYQITDNSTSSISYNLHMVPSVPGQSVAVTIHQLWHQ